MAPKLVHQPYGLPYRAGRMDGKKIGGTVRLLIIILKNFTSCHCHPAIEKDI